MTSKIIWWLGYKGSAWKRTHWAARANAILSIYSPAPCAFIFLKSCTISLQHYFSQFFCEFAVSVTDCVHFWLMCAKYHTMSYARYIYCTIPSLSTVGMVPTVRQRFYIFIEHNLVNQDSLSNRIILYIPINQYQVFKIAN